MSTSTLLTTAVDMSGPRDTGDVLLLLLDAVLFVFGVVQCAQGTFYSLADVAAAL